MIKVEWKWNVPNALSLLRLFLVPVIVVTYWLSDPNEIPYVSIGALVLSGISDSLDGIIGRHFNQITDIGKLLDPVADKLTQCAMMFCVAMRYPAMWWLLGLHVVKELIMIVMGWYVLKKTDTVNSAIWCGKLCTGVIYAVMMVHVIVPTIPQAVSAASAAVCAGLIILSLVVYTARYIKLLGGKK